MKTVKTFADVVPHSAPLWRSMRPADRRYINAFGALMHLEGDGAASFRIVDSRTGRLFGEALRYGDSLRGELTARPFSGQIIWMNMNRPLGADVLTEELIGGNVTAQKIGSVYPYAVPNMGSANGLLARARAGEFETDGRLLDQYQEAAHGSIRSDFRRTDVNEFGSASPVIIDGYDYRPDLAGGYSLVTVQ